VHHVVHLPRIIMFYSVVATQVVSHVSGFSYDRRWTAAFFHVTSYGIPHFTLENTSSRIFPFSPYCYDGDDLWMNGSNFFLSRMKAET